MTKYQLAEYTIINNQLIYEPIYFTKLPHFSNCDENSLKDITSFIGSFRSFEDMCTTLWNQKLIQNREYLESHIKITYKYKDQTKWLKSPFIYYDDLEFLKVANITSYVLKRIDSPNFLERLYDKFEDCPYQQVSLRCILNYFNKTINQEFISNDEKSELIEEVKNLIQRECYQYNSKEGTYKKNSDGTYALSYKSCYELACFLANDYHNFNLGHDVFDPTIFFEEEKEEFVSDEEYEEANNGIKDVAWVRGNNGFYEGNKKKTKTKYEQLDFHSFGLY